MKALIDDVTYSVEIGNTEYKIKPIDNFMDGLSKLLTQKQHDKFIGVDTVRTFNISKKRFIMFLGFLSTLKQ